MLLVGPPMCNAFDTQNARATRGITVMAPRTSASSSDEDWIARNAPVKKSTIAVCFVEQSRPMKT